MNVTAQTNTQFITSGTLFTGEPWQTNNTIVNGRLTSDFVRTNGIHMDTETGSTIQLGKSTSFFGTNVTVGGNSGASLKVEGNTTNNGNLTSLGNTNLGSGGKNTTITGATTNINTSNVNLNTAGGTVTVKATTTTIQGGNLNVTGNATNISTSFTTISSHYGLTVTNGITSNGINNSGKKITGVANGTSASDAVNKGQLDLEVNRLNANLEFTNENVRENTINITNLQNSKADKFQVELDIAQAKTEAITTSNTYTDTKVGALETKVNTEVTRLDGRIDNLDSKVNTEVSRLDGRIDATNQNVTNLSNRVTTEVARVDSRIDATNTTVEANKKEAADATAKVQSNLDKESKRLDMRIDTETQRVESKLNQRITEVDLRLNNRIDAVMTYVGNEFKAVNNRIEGLGASMVALSAAATSSVYNANKPTNLNIGTGFYGRSTAIAVGMSHFFNASTKVSVNWSQGSHTKNAVGIGAGFAF
jgi:hypothetical protein